MPILKNLGTHSGQSGGISAFFRGRRMLLFRRLTVNLPRPIRVLDLGGTQSYWESNDAVDADMFRVTLVNLPMNTAPTTRENFESRVGDATDLSAIDRSEFDLVYSNSVIEHLATWENQQRMAEQIQSLDLPFWIQTPNYHFPMEPHFHVMGFQWMSRERRIRMLQKKRCGMRGPAPEWDRAAALVDEIRLLKCREVRQMFPNATIYRERIGPFTKSIVAHQGLG
jgi:hypothetical protein